ncbi:pyridoxamine 5'-phosphate oxidase family protein [Streptomyces sp. NPDC006516]|uniref:pyridoxamine 5'-phosphate oxidase family protein n=1 Tax=Streptomyces sp. NPDC006516 TaxID=3154309 RepID=UPI0033BB755A
MPSSRPSCTSGRTATSDTAGTAAEAGPGVSGGSLGAGPGVSGRSRHTGPSATSSSDTSRAMELLGSVRYGRLAMSMRALPFLAVARHLVIEGRVVLRMHRGLGFHESCDGSVIAYGADNFNSPASGVQDLWSVQFTGPAEIVRPAADQRERFGTGPADVNGEHFDPVYLRLDPHVAHMHTLAFDATPSGRTHSVT